MEHMGQVRRGFWRFLVHDWVWWVVPLAVSAAVLVAVALLAREGPAPNVYPAF